MTNINEIFIGDCLDVMQSIPDKSIHMILCDLPYGTTTCKWDTVIPFEPLWEQYERIISDKGAIVLTASQPFTSALLLSNPKLFRYEWIWVKSYASGFTMAKHRPLKKHENILVFSKSPATTLRSGNAAVYNPQGLLEINEKKKRSSSKNKTTLSGGSFKEVDYVQKYTNYPNSVLNFPSESKTVHPTQKPVDLFEYLIRTYSNEGDIILDNCIGSGTTAVAAINTGRNFIGIEQDADYVTIARERVAEAYGNQC